MNPSPPYLLPIHSFARSKQPLAAKPLPLALPLAHDTFATCCFDQVAARLASPIPSFPCATVQPHFSVPPSHTFWLAVHKPCAARHEHPLELASNP